MQPVCFCGAEFMSWPKSFSPQGTARGSFFVLVSTKDQQGMLGGLKEWGKVCLATFPRLFEDVGLS